MEEEKKYTVYIHRNKLNNKCYIGITSKSPRVRWGNGSRYCGKSKNGEYKQPKFAHAIQKYGWDNFEHNILFTNLTKEKAC